MPTTATAGPAPDPMGAGPTLTPEILAPETIPSREAVRALRASGLSVGLIDMHTIKPLDRDAVLAAAERSRVILTVEEHNILGGLGGAVAEVMAEAGTKAVLIRHGIRDEYSLIAPPTHLYRHYQLDAAGIEAVVRDILA